MAVLVIGLLAGAPVWAGLHCLVTAAEAASACPMGMSGMSNDCPMTRMDVLACGKDCCAQQAPAVTAKLWLAEKASPGTVVLPIPVAKLILTRVDRDVPEMSSPPVYVLNRVFRI